MAQRMTVAFLGRITDLIRIVWPVLVFLILVITLLGMLVAYLEGWSLTDGIYFAFVTGLTIGYGDITPKRLISRVFSIMVGFSGIIFTGVVVAVAVQSLRFVLMEAYGNVEELKLQDNAYGFLTQAREDRKEKRLQKRRQKNTPAD